MSNIPPRVDLTTVNTLTFDGDDTLWDFRSAMEAALTLTLEELRRFVQSAAAQKLTTREMVDIRDCVAKEMEATVNLDEISLQRSSGRLSMSVHPTVKLPDGYSAYTRRSGFPAQGPTRMYLQLSNALRSTFA